MLRVEKYGVFELEFDAASVIEESAVEFVSETDTIEVFGFYEDEKYIVRFMPQWEGFWRYNAGWGNGEITGEFMCAPCANNNHGPVKANGKHLKYADGTRFFSVGTTCYAWIHQPDELIAQTMETLSVAPFNKVRMCVFPKSMPFNNNDPELYPFHKKQDDRWDVSSPDSRFWRHLEKHIIKLGEMGIEADLILFHPYDRWGFSNLTMEESLIYLKYCIHRLSAFRNIWWSLANEYDFIMSKNNEDWDVIGEFICNEDKYGHMTAIHNCFALYPKKQWMTHCSIQSNNVRNIPLWSKEYELPILLDECGYEGDIEFNWGNLSAFEMVNRFWICNTLGGFCTHGDTFYRDDEVLWWAKGGKIYGKSLGRLVFMRDLFEEIGDLDTIHGAKMFNPNSGDIPDEYAFFVRAIMALPEHEREQTMLGLAPIAGGNDDYKLYYLALTCPSYFDVGMPKNGKYNVEIIDVWEKTRKTVLEEASGKRRISLLGKEGVAILISRLEGESLRNS